MNNCGNNYYNFMNLQDYCDKMNLCYDGEWLRWVQMLMNPAISMFRYKGLPKNITSKILEQALLFRNFLCWYFEPSTMEYPQLFIWVRGSVYDEYWQPTKVTLMTLSGRTFKIEVPFEDLILVRDNTMDIIPFLTLNSWIEKIITYERTLSINAELLRLPTMFCVDKKMVSTVNQLFKNIKDFKPFVIADKTLADSVTPIKMDLPVPPSEMYDLIEKYRNLALASIGIYSGDTKRERLIASEVAASNDYSDMVYQGRLEERREWVEEYNRRYQGLKGITGLPVERLEILEAYVSIEDDEIENEAKKAEAVAKAESVKDESKEGKEDGRE